MKRIFIPLLTLALVGTLLLAGCTGDSSADTTTPSDQSGQNTPINAAQQYYSTYKIDLPDDFYRPDLIWNTGNLDTTKSLSNFRDDTNPDYPWFNKICLLISFPVKIDKTAKYAVEISIRQAEMNPQLVEYLSSKGWEAIELPEDHPRISSDSGILFAATREQIEALNAADVAAKLGDFPEGIECTLAEQSVGEIATVVPNIPEAPVFEYRPDLIWEYLVTNEAGAAVGYENASAFASAYEPGAGVMALRFVHVLSNDPNPTPNYVRPEDADKRFAVFFGYKGFDPANWDALVEYLTGLGYEEVGRAGGFSIPIFAMKVDEIMALDCNTLLTKMGMPTGVGLNVMIAANKDEDIDYDYHSFLTPWVTVEEDKATKPFADLQTDNSDTSVDFINANFYPESDTAGISMGISAFDSQNAAHKENFDRIVTFLKQLDAEQIENLPCLTYPYQFDVELKHADQVIGHFTVKGQHLIVHGEDDTYYEISRSDAQQLPILFSGKAGYAASTDPLNRLFEELENYSELTCVVRDLRNNRYTKFSSDPERAQSITDVLGSLPIADTFWPFDTSKGDITQIIEFYADPDSTEPVLYINLFALKNVIEIKPSSGGSIFYSWRKDSSNSLPDLSEFFKTV